MTYIHTQPWALYNEIDDHAAEWIENLIARGAVAPGIVDRRSIEDICPDELRGFRQVHFFAGIAVWSYSLRGAGISDDVAVWTGSCPCQPFSQAGQGSGLDDERHLWPALFHLIQARRPSRFYGEQVASKDGLGWLDLVHSDLENAGYALWAVDTCSAGSGSPHIRQRLRLCADDIGSSASWLSEPARSRRTQGSGFATTRSPEHEFGLGDSNVIDGLADISCSGWREEQSNVGRGFARTGAGKIILPAGCEHFDGLDNDDDEGLEGFGKGHRTETGQRQGPLRPVATAGGIEWVAHNDDEQQWQRGDAGSATGEGLRSELGGCYDPFALANPVDRHISESFGRAQGRDGTTAADARAAPNRPCPTNGFWRDADWLFCRDGKWRPVSASSQQMADGSAASLGFGSTSFPLIDGKAFKAGSGHPIYEGKSRAGMLKGYGNAIDAEATIDFIKATLGPDIEPAFEDLF